MSEILEEREQKLKTVFIILYHNLEVKQESFSNTVRTQYTLKGKTIFKIMCKVKS